MNSKLESTLKFIAESENLHDCVIENENTLSKGDGFTGNITVFKVTGRNNENLIQTINCIAKCAFDNEVVKKEIPIHEMYKNEAHMYRTVFPALRLLESEKLLTPLTFAPKYYGSLLDETTETIIMENLKVLGYRLHPIDFEMNGNHLKLILEHYARFHATSFALRDQQVEKFNGLTKNVKDLYIDVVLKTQVGHYKSSCREAALILGGDSDDFEAIQKFSEFVENTDALYEELTSGSTDKYCVIHGDAWTNNMMFNYEDETDLERPTSVRFLDFQVARVGSPVLDLGNIFYTACSKEVIDSLDYYLEYYYRIFSEHLEKLGSDPQLVYPFSCLKEQWRKFAKLYLLFVPFMLKFTGQDKNSGLDLEALADDLEKLFDEMKKSDIPNLDLFKDRMRHSIRHFYDNNFL